MSTIKSSNEHLTLNADGSSKDIKLQANASEKVIVKSDGKVGIGVSSPAVTLELAGNGGAVRLPSGGELQFGGSANMLYGSSASNFLRFDTNSTERMRVTDNGLTFNGDTAASNALDDYEEGTFTATLTSGTPPSSPPTATGNYTKIGNWVNFVIFRFSNVDTSGGSGEMKITGLPFTIGTSAISTNIGMRGLSFDTAKMLFAELHSGQTYMNFVESTSGGVWGNLNITAGTGKYLAISGSYKV